MLKTIHNSVNISPTEIILVSKLTLSKGEYMKNNVWLWSERFLRVYKYALRMNYASQTQNVQNNS